MEIEIIFRKTDINTKTTIITSTRTIQQQDTINHITNHDMDTTIEVITMDTEEEMDIEDTREEITTEVITTTTEDIMDITVDITDEDTDNHIKKEIRQTITIKTILKNISVQAVKQPTKYLHFVPTMEP